VTGVGHDLQYAVRLMRSRPGVSVAAVLTLALGIGANTAIFSVVNAVLMRPLPYASSDRLVAVSLALDTGFGERTSLPMADVLAWRAANRACTAVAAYAGAETVAVSARSAVLAGGEAEAIVATPATARFFDVLGVHPALGRLWRDGDDAPGAPLTVVISYGYWRQRLGADAEAIGRTLGIDGQPFTIIGVTPPGFAFPSRQGQLWTILPAVPPARRGPFFLRGLGLLNPAATVDQVTGDLALASDDVRRKFPGASSNPPSYRVESLKQVVTGDARVALVLLLWAVTVVLLLAIVNVATLLLARAAERERELAVRAALGAARGRLVRQLAIEGLLLASAGALVGWCLALWATRGLVAAAPPGLPRVGEIGMDLRVLGFTLLTTAMSGVLFAVSPAFQLSTLSSVGALQGGTRTSARAITLRIRRVLVTTQVALALALSVGAILLARSLVRLERVQVGFNPERLVTASIVPPRSRYPDGQQVTAFFDDVLSRVTAIPGVSGASVSNSLPPDGLSETDGFVVEDRLPPPGRGASVGPILSVGEDYFRVLGARMLEGRGFALADGPAAPRVAIVSASLARRHLGDLDPIGRRVKQVADWPKPDDNPWLTVVGVVDDVKYAGLAETTGPSLYVPLRQLPFRNQNLVVRVGADPAHVVSAIQRALQAVDPDVPLANVQSMDERVRLAAGQPRFRTWLMGLFGAIGLVLAAIGLYGVVSCSVAQRTREIGIRAALGATRRELIQMVLGESLTMVGLGAAVGLALSLAAGRLLTAVLFDLSPADPLTLIAATATLASVAMLAALLPARRAAAVDPGAALRSD
jgi:predicted permease